MNRPFVVVSGLPGSGKTALARKLAPPLGLPLIDKDEILERLFESQGGGDAAWRRMLSRESDRILQAEAGASHGAVLVSHWRLPGMRADSGTPVDWLPDLTDRIVHVRCVCPVRVAAERFVRRQRHPAHLDAKSYQEVVRSLEEVERLGSLVLGTRIEIDTSGRIDLDAALREIRGALAR